MTDVVVDASAGVEIALRTQTGRCTASASRPHLTLRIAERAEGWTEESR